MNSPIVIEKNSSEEVIQERLNSANSGELVCLEPGEFYTDGLTVPDGVILSGDHPHKTTVTAGKPVNSSEWKNEGDGMYSISVNGEPSILSIYGQQAGQMATSKMETGTGKTFGHSGFDLMQSEKSLTINTEWNGKGDFWKTLSALWGYSKGRVYLRMADKSKPPKEIMIAPQSRGIHLGRGSRVQNLALEMHKTATDFGDDNGRMENVIIQGGNKRVTLDNVSGCMIRNCDISMNFFGRRPNAWGGGSAEGEILYRFYKYFQGGSSSDDVSIDISNIGAGNIIEHCWIHDGAIGIRQTSASKRTSGPLIIRKNIIGYQNSVGLVWGFVNDDSEVYNNIFHNCNKQIRGWRLQLDGRRRFSMHHNWYYNPKGTGDTIYGHTTSNVKKTSKDIQWNQSNETMVGGENHFQWKNKIAPPGKRTDNSIDQLGKPVYDVDREMDFMGDERDYFKLKENTNDLYPGLLTVHHEGSPDWEQPQPDNDDDDDESEPIPEPDGAKTWSVYNTEQLIEADKTAKPGDTINIMGDSGTYGHIAYLIGKELTYNAIGSPKFQWSGHKAMRLAGSKSTFNLKGATFQNDLKDTIKLVGYQLTVNDLHIPGGGKGNKLSAAILLRGSECTLNDPVVENYYGDAIYGATDHLNQIITGVKVNGGRAVNCGGAAVQFNPHISGTMAGTHIIKDFKAKNVGFNSKKAAFVVTEKVGADQLHDKVLFDGCVAEDCEVAGFKAGRWGSAEVEFKDTTAQRCGIGYYVGYEGTGPVKFTNIKNIDNERDFAINPKTEVMGYPLPEPEAEPDDDDDEDPVDPPEDEEPTTTDGMTKLPISVSDDIFEITVDKKHKDGS